MNTKHMLRGLVALAAIIFLVVLWRLPSRPCSNCSQPQQNAEQSQETTVRGAGFTINVPEDVATTTDFKSYYHLPASWRDGAAESSGTPLFAVIVKRIENGETNVFPRYFDAEVRIGMSASTAECYENDQTGVGTAPQDVTLGGTAFKKFSIENAGMMQYLKGSSYRTIHNGACWAIEAFATGSNYRDDKTVESVSQDVLDAYLNEAERIARTFRFTK